MHRARQQLPSCPDVCIIGAGIIGLSLALELHHLGARVTVLERDTALSHASIAAAGMLAAHDPENPAELQPLSELSVALYPEFLRQIEDFSGLDVPIQTSRTLQSHPSYTHAHSSTFIPQLIPGTHRFNILNEQSVDPRQVAAALLASIRNTVIDLHEHIDLRSTSEASYGIHLDTSAGSLDTRCLIQTQGAWSIAPVTPRKGQMLSVALPPSVPLQDVIRTPEIYIVPRVHGPRAGHALIGATVEEAGFDMTTNVQDLGHLRAMAACLIRELADEEVCPTVDQWAGLRPATPDALPILGRLHPESNQFIATGHYRNGILLAPATAHVMAQCVTDQDTSVDLVPFSPNRFPQKA
jgi:glycine oxidase